MSVNDEMTTAQAVRSMLLLMPRLVGRAKRLPIPEALRGLDLAPRHLALLAYLQYEGPLTVSELAARLEVRVHMVTSASSVTQNVVTAVNRAGVHVDDTVFEALACADSVLRSDERELGVCLADIGAGSTEPGVAAATRPPASAAAAIAIGGRRRAGFIAPR